MSVLSLSVLALLFISGAGAPVELDASTLWTRVSKDVDTDLLVYFYLPAQQEHAFSLASLLTKRMHLASNPSTVLGLYDVGKHGWPSGLHVHTHADSGAVILFPAGGREPQAYDFSHDPLSVWPPKGAPQQEASVHPDGEAGAGEGGGEEEEGHEHHDHHHPHALGPSANGVLRFLKDHSSFPSEIPVVALSDLWEGREDGLFTAVLSGLDALHKRMAALQAENAQLQKELDKCTKKAA